MHMCSCVCPGMDNLQKQLMWLLAKACNQLYKQLIANSSTSMSWSATMFASYVSVIQSAVEKLTQQAAQTSNAAQMHVMMMTITKIKH